MTSTLRSSAESPATPGALDEAAGQLLGDSARSLVIDCQDVAFMDSAGLQVLVRAYQQAHEQGGTVTIRHPSAFIERLIQITGLDTVLVIDGDRDPTS